MLYELKITYDDESGDVRITKPPSAKIGVHMLAHALTGVAELVPDEPEEGILEAGVRIFRPDEVKSA